MWTDLSAELNSVEHKVQKQKSEMFSMIAKTKYMRINIFFSLVSGGNVRMKN